MNGATIEKGNTGHWLQPRKGRRVRITPAQASEIIPQCTRIDDQKTRCGATWAYCDCERPPTHISNACLIHNNDPTQRPTFYED